MKPALIVLVVICFISFATALPITPGVSPGDDAAQWLTNSIVEPVDELFDYVEVDSFLDLVLFVLIPIVSITYLWWFILDRGFGMMEENFSSNTSIGYNSDVTTKKVSKVIAIGFGILTYYFVHPWFWILIILASIGALLILLWMVSSVGVKGMRGTGVQEDLSDAASAMQSGASMARERFQDARARQSSNNHIQHAWNRFQNWRNP